MNAASEVCDGIKWDVTVSRRRNELPYNESVHKTTLKIIVSRVSLIYHFQ